MAEDAQNRRWSEIDIMALDTLALVFIVAAVAVWCFALFAGIVATLPYGLPALVVFSILGYFVYRVIRDRLNNKEDDYYEKNIDK